MHYLDSERNSESYKSAGDLSTIRNFKAIQPKAPADYPLNLANLNYTMPFEEEIELAHIGGYQKGNEEAKNSCRAVVCAKDVGKTVSVLNEMRQ